jgi:hypothetical protein
MKYPPERTATRTYAFYEYSQATDPMVLRSMEDEIWAALRFTAIRDVCFGQLLLRHPARAHSTLLRLVDKITSCISQAEEYYWLASKASSRTAPLLFYYSMLNLSKAFIFLATPTRLRTSNDFLHGLTDPTRLKEPARFRLRNETIETRAGIFSSLHFALTGAELKPRTSWKIGDLLQYCSWVSSEMNDLGVATRLIATRLSICLDDPLGDVWLRCAVPRFELGIVRGRQATFERQAPEFMRLFHRIKSSDAALLRYESNSLAYVGPEEYATAIATLQSAVSRLRLYWMPERENNTPDDVAYNLLALDCGGLAPLPEPCVILGMMFYLGSIVRYQPHIYEHLLGSQDAWLLESFVRQCPIVFAQVMLNHIWQQRHVFHRV